MRHTKYMRTILVLTCCLALTAAVRAEDQPDKNKKTTSKVVRKTAVTNTNAHVQGTHLQTRHTNTLPAVHSNTTLQSNKFHSNTTLQSNKVQSNKVQSNKFNSNTKFNSKAL